MESSLEGQIEGSNVDQCIRACMNCFELCTRTLSYCITQGGKHTAPEHLKLMMECMEMCRISATLLLTNAQFSHEHCQLNAKVCDACAKSIDEIAENGIMLECAESCRNCATSCRNMAH